MENSALTIKKFLELSGRGTGVYKLEEDGKWRSAEWVRPALNSAEVF